MKKLLFLFFTFLLFLPIISPIFAVEEPYRITYTITSFYAEPNRYNMTIAKQEAMVQQSFDAWIKNINAKAVYMKGADPKTVFCVIAFKPITTIGALGTGGGGGPNTWCTANTNSNLLLYIPPKPPFDGRVSWNALSIMTHEIGHGLGLGHMNCPGCVMQYSGATYTIPQKEEIAVLQKLWINAKCTIASCLTVPAIVDGELTKISTQQTNIVLGDKITFDYTITNLGNVEIYATILISDNTDHKTIKFTFEPPLLPGGTRTGFVIFNTTLSSIGTHEIMAYWAPITGDINISNNKKLLNIEILSSVPTPTPLPDPIDYKILINDGVSFNDSGEYTHTAIIVRKF